MKFATLVARNMRLVLRSRTTFMIIIAAPLLAVLLASVSFDNENQYALRIAYAGDSIPRMANQFLEDLQEAGFLVEKVASEEYCQSVVKQGLFHACMLIEPDENRQVSLTLLVDYANLQVVDYLLNKVGDKVAMQNSQISLRATEALLERIEATKEEVDKNRFVITALTTGQEEVSRQLDELHGKLEGMNPAVDVEAPQKLADMLKNETALTQLDAMARLKNDLVHRLSEFSDGIEAVLKESAMTESEKNAVRLIISKNDERVRRINDEFRVAQSLTQKDVDALKGTVKEIIEGLEDLKEEMARAKGVRSKAASHIRVLKGTLQDNLIRIVVLQSALNKIGASVDTLKVSRDDIARPIRAEVRPIGGGQYRLRAIFPTILVFMMMISGVLLSASLVCFHRNNPGSVRDCLMPVHPGVRLAALFATVFVLLLAQAGAGMGIAVTLMDTSILSGLPAAGSVLVMLLAVCCLGGMVLGFVCATEQGAILAGVALVTGSLILSDALFPVASMPAMVGWIASFNPFVIGAQALQRALMYQASIGVVFPRIMLLLVYGIVLWCILVAVRKERY